MSLIMSTTQDLVDTLEINKKWLAEYVAALNDPEIGMTTCLEDEIRQDIRCVKTALWAVEKQIAKEPVIGNEALGLDDKPYKVPSCPSYGEPTYGLRWCGFCGQKLNY